MRAHIGTLVVKELVVDAEDAAFRIDGCTDAMELLAGVVGRDQVLAAILNPFHRPAEADRCSADQNIFGIKLAADAKATADMTLVELHPRGRQSEHAGNLIAIPMGDLGRAVELENLTRAVVAAYGAAGFKGNTGVAPYAQLERNRRMGGAEGRINIAVFLADYARLGGAARFEFARLLI